MHPLLAGRLSPPMPYVRLFRQAEREALAGGKDLSHVEETSEPSDDGQMILNTELVTVVEMLGEVDDIIQCAATAPFDAATRWARLAPSLSDKASASKVLRDKVASCLDMLESWFVAEDETVKQAACEALEASAEAELPGIDAGAERFIPVSLLLLQALSVSSIHQAALSALVAYVDELPSHFVAPQVGPIVECLLHHLSVAPTEEAEDYVEALGTLACAVESAFVPVLAQAIQPLLTIQARPASEQLSTLRVAVQEALSAFVEASGPEAFRPFLQSTLAVATAQASSKPSAVLQPVKPEGEGDGDEDDDAESDAIALRCASFDFFGAVAKTYGAEIADALPSICPVLLETIERDEEAELEAALGRFVLNRSRSGIGTDTDVGADAAEAKVDQEKQADESPSSADDDNDDDDYEDVDEGEDDDSVSGLISFETDQGHAISACVEIFSAAKQAFAPYLERVGAALLKHVKSEGDMDVVLAAAQGLLKALEILQEMSGAAKWEQGASLVPFCAEAQQLVTVAMPKILELLDESAEEDSDLDSLLPEICISLGETLEKLGPALLTSQQVETLCETIKMVLEQQSSADAEDNVNNAGARSLLARISGGSVLEDLEALRAVINLLGTLLTVYGPAITPFVSANLTLILRFARPSNSSSQRCIALACLAEVASGFQSAVTPFTQPISAAIVLCLDKDENSAVRTNALNALGFLVQNSDDAQLLQQQSLCEALTKVEDAFKRNEVDHNDVLGDNACALVARILLKDDALLPLEQLGPVWLAALPIRVDFEETETVITALDKLIRAENPLIVSQLPQILSYFATVLDSTKYGVWPEAPLAQVSQKGRDVVVKLARDLATGPQAAAVEAAGLGAILQ
ncbi:BZ3500_MvSof-1268-A1-R1_Chr9g10720 [Microbotryum saponariae]|uniref:BZ3500_MvSof-1268-A1-R1_Chr9g10720 protein n=1 Tax=Microbotryum saponariae TaxID=289078 RepID=A0A2X0L1Z8_9BASI|nr:BZ3501_MvSof-1269-A2-R1_Chr9g10468 [Microbotryum saponariae]SDA00581.1 BZ3500_MvSof-1268-A1-R1_Chr9g10720 [Microbotryum saponariae]